MTHSTQRSMRSDSHTKISLALKPQAMAVHGRWSDSHEAPLNGLLVPGYQTCVPPRGSNPYHFIHRYASAQTGYEKQTRVTAHFSVFMTLPGGNLKSFKTRYRIPVFCDVMLHQEPEDRNPRLHCCDKHRTRKIYFLCMTPVCYQCTYTYYRLRTRAISYCVWSILFICSLFNGAVSNRVEWLDNGE